MGSAIAERLIETGNTVTVWNRSAEKCKPLVAAGASVVASAAALAGTADTVPGPATFTLDNSVKNLRIILTEGARCGIEMPLVSSTLACFEEASHHGLGTTEGAACRCTGPPVRRASDG
jgi:3-hydroxyisobutyrate dehydrogenase-like beta-hydroxyacid dehydrogenase